MNKTFYWIATAIMCAIMIFSASNYFFNYEMIAGYFEVLGYPTYLIYPLAIAKVLGVIAIIGNFSKPLKEWAYAGFFFDMLLALVAHIKAEDGGYLFALVGLIALGISYFFWKRNQSVLSKT